MAPNGARAYTVTCALAKAVPDAAHIEAIRAAVARVHKCTFLATDLLNLYVRERLELHDGTGLENIFKQNWLMNAYNAVSRGAQKPKIDAAVQAVFNKHMDSLVVPVDRAKIAQALAYECLSLATTGQTNVWMHFRKRVLAYTRTCFALGEEAYKALTKDERRKRKLALMQAAEDVCRPPEEAKRSPEEYHEWVQGERVRLQIDAAVGVWSDKPLLYHLKANPHLFLHAMHLMSTKQHSAGRKAFALFPLRRTHVPRHVRFDKHVLDTLLSLKAVRAQQVARKEAVPGAKAPKRARDDPSLLQEKAEVFGRVLDLRAAKVHRRAHFAFAFTTDGVSLHLHMEKPGAGAKVARVATRVPARGMHSIDQLKHLSREKMHVVGIDPGKVELIVAVDSDDPLTKPVVRYTEAQRRFETHTKWYAYEATCDKPLSVESEEQKLSLLNSKAPSLEAFANFSRTRLEQQLDCEDTEAFYADLEFRHRRRKVRIKAQQSESRLVARLRGMHAPDDPRRLVLAYGAWGLVAGRPGAACNKGNAPAIGVGLMRKLARDFVVVPTPEHHTSKTCVKCRGVCGAHPTLKTKNGKSIRGLRVCQHEGCGLLQNRDKTGATNIGTQLLRLLGGEGPLRPMSPEELQFHELNTCLDCTD